MLSGKVHIFILCISLFGCSSTPAPEPKLLFSQQMEQGLQIEMYQLHSKVGPDGKKQCVNYARSERNDSIYQWYGFDIISALGLILKVPEKHIESNRDSLASTFVDVKVRFQAPPEVEEDLVKAVALNSILDVFKLKMDTLVRPIEAWEVVLENQELLAERKSSAAETLGIRSTRREMHSEGATISEFIRVLNNDTNEEVFTEIVDDQFYELTLPLGKLEDIQQFLAESGLALASRKREVEVFVLTDQ